MKRIIFAILAVFVALSVTACAGNKDEAENDGTSADEVYADIDDLVEKLKNAPETPASAFEYKEVDGGIIITEYIGSDKIIVIPDMIDGLNVISIGEAAFAIDDNIVAVKLSDNVEEINMQAFAMCEELRVFISGKNVKTIGDAAFSECEKLQIAELNEGLEKLMFACFAGSGIREVYVPKSVTYFDGPFWSMVDGEVTTIIGEPGSPVEEYVAEKADAFELEFKAKS